VSRDATWHVPQAIEHGRHLAEPTTSSGTSSECREQYSMSALGSPGTRRICVTVTGNQVKELQGAERAALDRAAASDADVKKLQASADELKRDLQIARDKETRQQSVLFTTAFLPQLSVNGEHEAESHILKE
jgi:hypothetical protein